MIRREAHSVQQQLATIERAQVSWQWIAKADSAKEPVVSGIGNRNGIGELLGGVDPIVMADRPEEARQLIERFRSDVVWPLGDGHERRP